MLYIASPENIVQPGGVLKLSQPRAPWWRQQLPSALALSHECVWVCFAGWRDTESAEDPLVYILLASRHRAGHYHEFCVYKGSRAEHSAFLPPGFHESGFVVSVSVLVQDQLGATVVAINQ